MQKGISRDIVATNYNYLDAIPSRRGKREVGSRHTAQLISDLARVTEDLTNRSEVSLLQKGISRDVVATNYNYLDAIPS